MGRQTKPTILLRNLIPAVIVALVLGASFAISAGATQDNKDKENPQCGYGYTHADKDENGTEHGQNNDTKSHGEDNDRCEDEADGEDSGGNNGRGGDTAVTASATGGSETGRDRASDRGSS